MNDHQLANFIISFENIVYKHGKISWKNHIISKPFLLQNWIQLKHFSNASIFSRVKNAYQQLHQGS